MQTRCHKRLSHRPLTMTLRSHQHTITPSSWIKALLLSPGILYLSAYLALYGAISVRLNGTFKEQIQQRYRGGTHRITIGAVSPSLGLDAITIRKIEIIPTSGCPENQRLQTNLEELSFDMPDLQKTLFSNAILRQSASIASEKIRKHEPKAQ